MIYRVSDVHPWVVLIHGLGATEQGWIAPLEEQILFVTFKTLLKEEPEIVPFAERLKGQYNIATWTQRQHSTIDEGAHELYSLVQSIESKRIIFIAHSRGGLVARRAIQNYTIKPTALICLSTPHYGSRLADFFVKYFSILRWILSSLEGYEASIKELCTNSPFIREINGHRGLERERDIPHYDICGNSTSFFHLIRIGSRNLLNMVELSERIFGTRTIPELKRGYGDGMTSVQSCRSPLTAPENHIVLPVNHANILVDRRVWDSVQTILQKHSDNLNG